MCGRVHRSSDVNEKIKLVTSGSRQTCPAQTSHRSWNAASTDPPALGARAVWAKHIKIGFANINAKAEGIEGDAVQFRSISSLKVDFGMGSDTFEPPKYLANLIAAVNDGAKVAQANALFFALIGLYLLATAFSASDEDLLRGRTVTISQIGATLPISFSFAIAPLVFVFLHIYTLARYDMLAANVRQFLAELHYTVALEADRERCRQLLANVEFVQALVAPSGSRLYSWIWRWLVCVVIAIFPVFVLLLVQINALRYQSALIMWVQRASLFIDLLALVW